MLSPKERLLEMLKERSFRYGEFTLASGKKSDFFIDCKRTILTPDGHTIAGHVVLDEVERLAVERQVDGLAAVPLGGCPLVGAASLLAYQRGNPLQILYVRTERKDHGTGRRVEGRRDLEQDASIVLVEDVITTGGSSIRAVEALREAGLTVSSVVVLVDRDEGGRENLTEQGVDVRSIYRRSDFIPRP